MYNQYNYYVQWKTIYLWGIEDDLRGMIGRSKSKLFEVVKKKKVLVLVTGDIHSMVLLKFCLSTFPRQQVSYTVFTSSTIYLQKVNQSKK